MPASLLLLLLWLRSAQALQFSRTLSPSICRSAGFFRHPEDCTKFYRCVDRSRTLRSYQIFFFRDIRVITDTLHSNNYPLTYYFEDILSLV